MSRWLALLLLSASLGGCSYTYDVLALLQNGNVVFTVDPGSGSRPSCVRRVEVFAQSNSAAGASWLQSVSYGDECANRFQLTYGVSLSGEAQEVTFGPKPLVPEVIYEVSTTTGATGYGSGRFLIRSNGRVENLPR